jgi:putative transposase
MKKENLVHARTCVYNCNYHIVFSTKYRRKVLTGEIEKYLQNLFREIAQEKGFIVSQAEVGEQDHVHMFVSAHPKVSPSYMVKMLKGTSARKILLKYPELQKQLYKGHLWNPSYYIETIGSISEEAIRKYIEAQSSG